MTNDGKWLEEQLNLQNIVDCGGETLAVDRYIIHVDAPYAVLKNAVIIRIDSSKHRFRGAGRLLNFRADYPTVENVTLLGPMAEDDFLKAGGSMGHTVAGEHGIGLMGVTQPTLRNVTIKNFYGDGVYCASRGGSKSAKQNVNGLFDHLVVWNTGRHGLTLTSMDGCRIMNGTRLEYARRRPLDRERVHPVDKIRRIVVDPDTVRCNRSRRMKGKC